MHYEAWLLTVPSEITEDPLWNMQVYRKSLFLGDIAWHDAMKISKMGRWRQLSDQLYRAVGGISATISEGYSYRNMADELRYYRYALGSARESRDWYFKSRRMLGETVAQHRIKVVTDIIRQLMYLVSTHPKRNLREQSEDYTILPQDDTYFTDDAPLA